MKDKRKRFKRAAVLLFVLLVAMLSVACDELSSPTEPGVSPSGCEDRPIEYRHFPCIDKRGEPWDE